MASVTITRTHWAQMLLQRLGIAATAQNVKALVAWQQGEGTSAKFNPLATTQGATGASNFNSVGVKNYTSLEQGLDATVSTLRNGYYGPILAALKQGTSAIAVAQAIANSPWGTGKLVLKILGAGNVDMQASQPVGVAETDPAPKTTGAANPLDLGAPQTGDAGLAQAQENDPLHAYVNALGGMLGVNLPAPGQWDPGLMNPPAAGEPAQGAGTPEAGTEPTTTTVATDKTEATVGS